MADGSVCPDPGQVGKARAAFEEARAAMLYAWSRYVPAAGAVEAACEELSTQRAMRQLREIVG